MTSSAPANPHQSAYHEVVSSAVQLLDRLAVVRPDHARMERCRLHLMAASRALEGLDELPENIYAPAHAPENPRFQPAERGLTPSFDIKVQDDQQILGTVMFSPRFSGTASVHGGALALFFDDALGRIANRSVTGGVARTAYLRTDFRRLAPLEVALDCRTWIDRAEARKKFVRGQLLHRGDLIAEAEGLWITPRRA